ncbi:MAG: [FeFe] hydrogenase H-cluster radical SAM maturase HydE [Ruminococcus sp.]|nr:[FeFe] hydrogenase H-cluster radical SAM maturase HydE [Ruminococcus sp.]
MSVISEIASSHSFSDKALLEVLSDDKYDQELFSSADEIRRSVYGADVYIRGLIEFTNYCKNDCLYCGIRRSNSDCDRYRLTREDIYGCCEEGYSLGFRTFVLQGGEDMSFKDDDICEIVYNIKSRYPDCAVTLSIGERSRESYSAFKSAGADRYLLRHETANVEHYSKIHPQSMSLENRKNCLFTLKELGYQVGSGFMVGSPFQTLENLVEDFKFLQTLGPDMIGIGPFISHKNTPFKDFPNGSLELTLRLVALLRLVFPKALIPATTALGTLHPNGRELGLKCGANVVMPNLSPVRFRKKYELYDNKICTGEESAQCRTCLDRRVKSVGYKIVTDRGDARTIK